MIDKNDIFVTEVERILTVTEHHGRQYYFHMKTDNNRFLFEIKDMSGSNVFETWMSLKEGRALSDLLHQTADQSIRPGYIDGVQHETCNPFVGYSHPTAGEFVVGKYVKSDK
jgi:hypothetical protein